MPWQEFFIPLDPDDPLNADRLEPRGERVRVRLNTERGQVVDFVIQYETVVPELAGQHGTVVRFDGSHARGHYHVFSLQGMEIRKGWLAAHVSYNDAVQIALDHIARNWRQYRLAFSGEEPWPRIPI